MDPSASIGGWEIGLLTIMLAGSFFFAGTETVLSSLGEAKARQMRERLGTRGRVLSLWIDHPKKVLTSLLIGNNLVNIGATALTTEIALKFFGNAALAIVTGGMTFLILVVGEITPKTLARENAERVAVPALILHAPMYFLVYPFSWILVRFTGGISKLFGGTGKPPPVTSEEIDYLIGLGSATGALSGVKRELLTSVLEFTDLLAKEIMVPRTRMVGLEATTPLEEVQRVLRASEHSRIPVYEGHLDNIIGILYAKELLGTVGAEDGNGGRFDLRRHLRPAFFVPEVMKVSRLMKEMQRRHSHMSIVVDEFGGTSGLVTLEDVVEEIVGDIHDETDSAHHPVRRLADGKMLADASIFLRDLEELLDIDFPDDGDYETLGGFLTATAGQVPPVGSLVAYGGHTFTVRSASDTRVLSVEIALAPEGTDTGAAGENGGGPSGNGGVFQPPTKPAAAADGTAAGTEGAAAAEDADTARQEASSS